MSKIDVDKLARYVIYYGDINGTNITTSKLQKLLFLYKKNILNEQESFFLTKNLKRGSMGLLFLLYIIIIARMELYLCIPMMKVIVI